MIEPSFRYLSAREVAEYRGCSIATFYNDIKEGRWPPGERLGANTVRWRSDVVAGLLEEQSRSSKVRAEEGARKARERALMAVEGKRRKAAERAARTEPEKLAA